MAANVAIIIPVRDDTAALARLLDRISAWSTRPAAVIVVAASPDDALAALCARSGSAFHVLAANRGAQLDYGARQADAPTLWFLHADVVPPNEGVALVAAAAAEGADGGCFRFGFQGASTWPKRVLTRLVAARIRLGGVPYGDQGLFVQRAAYAACGGFPHQPLFEEVRLVRRLRRHGRFGALPQAVLVSTRRWDRDGWWRRTLLNRWLALCYMLGVPAERLARGYHGDMETTVRINP